jgi:hypothetical protein
MNSTPGYRIRIGLPVLLLLLAAACGLLPEGSQEPTPTVDPVYVDPAFLSGEPCEPPCWNGFELGVSRPDEVYEFARSSPYYEEANIEDKANCPVLYHDPETGANIQTGDGRCVWLRCEGVIDQACAMFWFKDELLIGQILSPSVAITLGEVIDRYGEPDYFAVTPGQRAYTCQSLAFWRERHFVIINRENNRARCRDVIAPSAATGLVSPDLLVTEVFIHQPGYFDYGDVIPWQGLQDVD